MKTQMWSFVGITGEIEKIITEQWQTSTAIASQVVFPPDVVQRVVEASKSWQKTSRSESSAKSLLVGQAIRNLVRRGSVEKRYIHKFKCEYRLATQKQKDE